MFLFSLGWRFIRYALGTGFFVVLFLVVLIFDFQNPELPTTELGVLEARTYYMSLEDLSDARRGEPTEVVLSPQETSYLFERYYPDVERYGFELAGIHLEAEGDSSKLRTAFGGPLGLYVRLTFVGTVKLVNDRWIVRVRSLSVGELPISWLVPSKWEPDWPKNMAGDRLEVESGRLDGRGLKATVINRGLDLNLSMDLLEKIN